MSRIRNTGCKNMHFLTECGFTLVNSKTLKLDLLFDKLSLFFRVPDILEHC
jgi:hypothetical protein